MEQSIPTNDNKDVGHNSHEISAIVEVLVEKKFTVIIPEIIIKINLAIDDISISCSKRPQDFEDLRKELLEFIKDDVDLRREIEQLELPPRKAALFVGKNTLGEMGQSYELFIAGISQHHKLIFASCCNKFFNFPDKPKPKEIDRDINRDTDPNNHLPKLLEQLPLEDEKGDTKNEATTDEQKKIYVSDIAFSRTKRDQELVCQCYKNLMLEVVFPISVKELNDLHILNFWKSFQVAQIEPEQFSDQQIDEISKNVADSFKYFAEANDEACAAHNETLLAQLWKDLEIQQAIVNLEFYTVDSYVEFIKTTVIPKFDEIAMGSQSCVDVLLKRLEKLDHPLVKKDLHLLEKCLFPAHAAEDMDSLEQIFAGWLDADPKKAAQLSTPTATQESSTSFEEEKTTLLESQRQTRTNIQNQLLAQQAEELKNYQSLLINIFKIDESQLDDEETESKENDTTNEAPTPPPSLNRPKKPPPPKPHQDKPAPAQPPPTTAAVPMPLPPPPSPPSSTAPSASQAVSAYSGGEIKTTKLVSASQLKPVEDVSDFKESVIAKRHEFYSPFTDDIVDNWEVGYVQDITHSASDQWIESKLTSLFQSVKFSMYFSESSQSAIRQLLSKISPAELLHYLLDTLPAQKILELPALEGIQPLSEHLQSLQFEYSPQMNKKLEQLIAVNTRSKVVWLIIDSSTSMYGEKGVLAETMCKELTQMLGLCERTCFLLALSDKHFQIIQSIEQSFTYEGHFDPIYLTAFMDYLPSTSMLILFSDVVDLPSLPNFLHFKISNQLKNFDFQQALESILDFIIHTSYTHGNVPEQKMDMVLPDQHTSRIDTAFLLATDKQV